uniref:Protein kinase domain-containing protein n=1 Tax=Panagrolaimus superbus TaxID=310955 RepID=A0A914Y2H0_9BILA
MLEKSFFTTIVENIDSKVQRFLKIEASEKQKPGIPSLNRDVKFLSNATKTKRMDHFLKFIEKFSFPGRFNAYIFELGGLPLSDIRTKLFNGELFSRGCFARICLLSLRAIHDVHYNFFIHRDIRPSNFLTSYGTNKKGFLYLINFSISYDFSDDSLYSSKVVSLIQSRRPPKLPWINCCYQSRDYHEGRLGSRHNDIESWLYTMMFFYDSKCLPWDSVKTERELLTYKELLNSGYYEGEFKDFDKYLHVMLNHLNQHLNSAAIDFPFYFSVLKLMCKEWNIAWPMVIFDWDRPFKDFTNLPKLTPVKKKAAEKNETILPKHIPFVSSSIPSFTKRKDITSSTTTTTTAVSPAVMTAIAKSPNNNYNAKSKQTQEFVTQNTEETTSKMKDAAVENEILEEKTAKSDRFLHEDENSSGAKDIDEEFAPKKD